jgi:hypothetical protein
VEACKDHQGRHRPSEACQRGDDALGQRQFIRQLAALLPQHGQALLDKEQ